MKDTSFICSNKYSDKTLAKGMCPFKGSNCGGNQAFNFDQVGQSQTLSISLPVGEACTFQITAGCGLPQFKPSDTTGFQIDVLDYDDDDIGAKRLLQTAPATTPAPATTTSTPAPATATPSPAPATTTPAGGASTATPAPASPTTPTAPASTPTPAQQQQQAQTSTPQTPAKPRTDFSST
jgi:hypothetical protein